MRIELPELHEDMDDDTMFEVVNEAINDLMKTDGIVHVVDRDLMLSVSFVSTLLRSRIQRGNKDWIKVQKAGRKDFVKKLKMAEALSQLLGGKP